jgi:CheY-like chemotaxis protein
VRRAIEAALRVTHNEIHHRARLVTELADVPSVLGNEQRLEQVFLNLLVNAVQALPDGRADNEIRVVLRANAASEVVVEISDNGSGIPDDVRARIFDPFFTTKRIGMGLGLGLSICHGIVTSHGGTIAAESAIGRGSTLRVVLPGSREQASTVTPEVERPVLNGDPLLRGQRVLVIDDEPALVAVIARMLEGDCHVDVAVGANDGLALLTKATTPYDAILCDLMMPDMTGMDLFAEVSRQRAGVAERFVFMTGGAFTPRAAAFLARVKNHRIEKPFDRAALVDAIARRA